MHLMSILESECRAATLSPIALVHMHIGRRR